MRKFLIALSLLFLLLAVTAPGRLDNSTGSFREESTDQISHWGGAILYWKHGMDVYRHSPMQLCLPMTAQATQLYRADQLPRLDYACLVSDHPTARPVLINHPERVQSHPQGKFLYSAPEALLYAAAGVGYPFLKKLTLIKYLLVSHLVFALFVWLLLPKGRQAAQLAMILLLGPLFYQELVFWALYGIYDAVAVGALFGAIYFLSARQPVRSLVCYALAAFLHFRALWLLPIAVAACFQLPALLRLKRSRQAALLAALALFEISVYALILAMPDISNYAVTNSLLWRALIADPSRALAFLVPFLALAGFLIAQRAWLALSLVIWQAFILVQTPDVRPWHGLFYLPIIAAGLIGRSPTAVTAALTLFNLALNLLVFAHQPWPLSGVFLGYTFGIGK